MKKTLPPPAPVLGGAWCITASIKACKTHPRRVSSHVGPGGEGVGGLGAVGMAGPYPKGICQAPAHPCCCWGASGPIQPALMEKQA